RLAKLDCDLGEDFWTTVQPNLVHLSDVTLWASVVKGPITPIIEDTAFAATAASVLPPEPWSGDTWKLWTDAVKDKTGAKGKGLFMPLRLALTAHDHGPELKNLLPLIGRERALARLSGSSL